MNIGSVFPVSVPGPNDPGIPDSGDGNSMAFASLLSLLVPVDRTGSQCADTVMVKEPVVPELDIAEDQADEDVEMLAMLATVAAAEPRPAAVVPEVAAVTAELQPVPHPAPAEATSELFGGNAVRQWQQAGAASGNEIADRLVRAIRDAVVAKVIGDSADPRAEAKEVPVDAESSDGNKEMPLSTGSEMDTEAGFDLADDAAVEYGGADDGSSEAGIKFELPGTAREVNDGGLRSATMDIAAVRRAEQLQSSGSANAIAEGTETAPPQRSMTDAPKIAQPVSHATVKMDVGGSEARVRVAVRGETVTATVTVDAADAPMLTSRVDELKQGLREQGFQEARVVIRSAEGTEAASGQRIGAALDNAAKPAGELRMERSAGTDQRDRNESQRSAPERERQQRRSQREQQEAQR